MISRIMLIAVLATTVVAAQRGGGGGGNQGGGSEMGPRALTPFEEFASKLKIDVNKQGAEVEKIFAESAKEAAPVAQEILQLRQRLINADLTGKPDDFKAALDAYTAAHAKMTAIETACFGKVFAILSPQLQARGPQGFEQAFAIMAGFFQAAAPPGGGGRGRGGVQ